MNDPQRMKQLSEALALIDDSTDEEKAELFSWPIASLAEHDERLSLPDNRFDSHESHAYAAMDELCFFVRRLTGYNTGWIPEAFIEHCSDKTGRRPKYDLDTRQVNCVFIALMCDRGASETQAMKLLLRLRGDYAMTQGQMRELQDTYRDFKKLGRPDSEDLTILKNAFTIGNFLKFDISNLKGDEKASEKAVQAFRDFWDEVITLMKANLQLVSLRDKSYPEVFGPVLDWINAEYDDPLDYFYTHETHTTVPIHARRRGLVEYINSVATYREALPQNSKTPLRT